MTIWPVTVFRCLLLSLLLAGCVATGTAFYNPRTEQTISCGVQVGWSTPVMAPVLFGAAAIDRARAKSCDERARQLGFITEDDLVPPTKEAEGERAACEQAAPSAGLPTTFGLENYEWNLRRRTEAIIRCLLARGWTVREQ
jgi:hypothetical protein